MKALRHRFNEWLAVTGLVGLVIIAIPVVAVLLFVLRAVLLAAAAVGLAAGAALWLMSPTFRAWFSSATATEVTYKGMRLVTDVAMHPGHSWARMAGTDVMVGADDLLPTALGPVQSVELPPAGREVARGDVLFRLRRDDRVVEMPAPVGGTVVAGNQLLAAEPGLVNTDPFQLGWVVKLRGTPGLGRDRRELRRGQPATEWFRTEVDKLLSIVQDDGVTVAAMADGGAVTGDFYQRIDDPTWQRVTEALGGTRS